MVVCDVVTDRSDGGGLQWMNVVKILVENGSLRWMVVVTKTKVMKNCSLCRRASCGWQRCPVSLAHLHLSWQLQLSWKWSLYLYKWQLNLSYKWWDTAVMNDDIMSYEWRLHLSYEWVTPVIWITVTCHITDGLNLSYDRKATSDIAWRAISSIWDGLHLLYDRRVKSHDRRRELSYVKRAAPIIRETDYTCHMTDGLNLPYDWRATHVIWDRLHLPYDRRALPTSEKHLSYDKRATRIVWQTGYTSDRWRPMTLSGIRVFSSLFPYMTKHIKNIHIQISTSKCFPLILWSVMTGRND